MPILCSRHGGHGDTHVDTVLARELKKASAGTLCAHELLARNGFKHTWIQGSAHGQVLPKLQTGEAHMNCGFHVAEGLLGKIRTGTDKFYVDEEKLTPATAARENEMQTLDSGDE
jgi:hypothetical protein